MYNKSDLVYVGISKKALLNNITELRKLVGPERKLAGVIKSNAYGHGILEVASIISPYVDAFVVHCADDVARLREAGHKQPIIIVGYVQKSDMEWAIENGAELNCSGIEYATWAAAAAAKVGKKAALHIKVETGTNRLGAMPGELIPLGRFIAENPHLELKGIYSHYANIEDTTDHSYAMQQLANYNELVGKLEKELGFKVPVHHTACSAAIMLFPETRMDLVRAGIALYGLWPSRETLLSCHDSGVSIRLEPVMSIHTKVAHIKEIPADSYISYGCTYRTSRPTKLAILPIGYFDGFERHNSGIGYVLINGRRAPVRGRVAMNLTMVDITDIPDVKLEDEVVIMGRQGEESISAEQIAAWCNTINYEVVTRFAPFAPKIIVD